MSFCFPTEVFWIVEITYFASDIGAPGKRLLGGWLEALQKAAALPSTDLCHSDPEMGIGMIREVYMHEVKAEGKNTILTLLA